VYQYDGDWFQLQKLVAKLGSEGDQFGLGLAMDLERIVIGAPWSDDGKGQAHLFDRGNVMFFESELFIDPNGESMDNFGFAIDVETDTVAIGSYLNDDVATDAGSVFIFASDLSGWDLYQHILPTGNFAAEDQFGVSVSLNDSNLLIGSRYGLVNGEQAGDVTSYEIKGGVWLEGSTIVSPNPTLNAEFGWAVAIDGDYGLIGEPWLEPDGNAHFYDGFMSSCECVGDLNGDNVVGVTDLLQLIGEWGFCENCDEDLDGNGFVDVSDLLQLINFWGACL
jgi:hypothetical protein